MITLLNNSKNKTLLRFIIIALIMLLSMSVLSQSVYADNASAEPTVAENPEHPLDPGFDKPNWEGTGMSYTEWWRSVYDDLKEQDGPLMAFCWGVVTTVAGANPDFSLATVGADIYRFSSYSGKWITGNNNSTLIHAGKNMYQSMSTVGLALIFLYFLIEILDEVQADNFNVEHLIKKLITLAVAIIVVLNGAQIFDYISQLGDALISDAVDTAAVGSAVNPRVKELGETLLGAETENGFVSAFKRNLYALGLIAENIIPWLITIVALLIIYLISFSRFIEFLVRFAFAPIGMAPLVSGGAKSAGMRYIKKFASCVIQGAVCVLAIGSVSIIQSLANEVNSILAGILLPLTLIGFVTKSQRIADDIVGV